MRLGNAAVVDDCSSQGLPDFYFFSLSLSSLLLSLASFFLSLGLSTLPRASLFAPSCSLPPAPPRRREREGGDVVEAAVEEEEAHTETLICFFRYSPYFPPRPPRTAAAPLPSFAALFLLLPLLPFFFHCLLFFSHAVRIPSPDCNSAGLSAPRIAVYFYCDVLPPPPPAYPPSAPFPASPTSTDARARVLFIRVAPAFFHLSFFLSFRALLALPVVSNFAKGWRRECAPRPSRGGVFFLPPLPSTLRLVLLLYPLSFFSRSFFFSFLPSRAVLISRVRALRSRDREKY